jgi:hypothetical protein
MQRHEDMLVQNEDMFTLDEIRTAIAELEYAGLIEPTGEMRWGERSGEWRPVYALTELGRALSAAGIGFDEYQNSQRN